MTRSPDPVVLPIPSSPASPPPAPEPARLSDLSAQQWKSGVAAWLGWMFDGLDMHLYTAVATPFVAGLLLVPEQDPDVKWYSSVIMAAFLLGWALGGGFFGRVGDRIGRTRALNLTILTYAGFTGLSFFAQTWWQLMIFRFLAALGIGGEWAVGASLLCETWPKRWRPWMAAVLQTGVNIGAALGGLAVMLLARYESRYVFLVGILPALLVLWIRKAVPEPESWHTARSAAVAQPGIFDLFRGRLWVTSTLTIIVCATSLTAHWAFIFWSVQHLNGLPELQAWTEPDRKGFVAGALAAMMLSSVAGNFVAAGLARWVGFRRAIAVLCAGYFVAMTLAYATPWDHITLFWWMQLIAVCQGVFALFTMYLPPLFPVLLRTTGAGFTYNIGRIASAAGVVYFGLFSGSADATLTLRYSSFLFLPAIVVALMMPDPPADEAVPAPID